MRDAAARGESWPPRAMGLAAFGVLAAFAHRRLLSFGPERSLPEELEQWFFLPTESLTPLVVGLALWLLFRRKARLQALPEAPGSLRVGVILRASEPFSRRPVRPQPAGVDGTDLIGPEWPPFSSYPR